MIINNDVQSLLISILSDPDADPTSTASIIGILVAISGNVLISLALNCQKLAHQRLEKEREKLELETGSNVQSPSGQPSREAGSRNEDGDVFASGATEGNMRTPSRSRVESTASTRTPKRKKNVDHAQAILLETEPLLRVVERNGEQVALRTGYGLGLGERVEVRDDRDDVLMGKKGGKVRRGLRGLFSTPKRNKPALDVERDIEAGADVEVIIPYVTDSTPEGQRTPARESFAIEFPTSSPDTHTDTDRTAYHTDGDSFSPKAAKNNSKDDSSSANESDNSGNNNESDYLRSKLWWFGFLLMNIGEMGNFISYGFAPASVVAPLGTFALIANCLFAPFMLGEKFRKRDFFGITLAILGAVTVVLATNPSDVRLDPAGLVKAITQKPFIALAIIYIVGLIVLMSLSSGRVGREWVFVDVGICAFFGGFTVLSTKGFSTLLTMEWWAIFKEWITYPLVAVMIGTGVGQIKYLNRALMKFDSKVVIPTQFVLFNLSAIVGSAVLYGDFRKATLHQMVTFLYGCGATFTGVFILTWTRNSGSEGEVGEGERGETEHVDGAGEEIRVRSVRLSMAGTKARMMRRRRSTATLMGLSPAQRVLLVESIGGSENSNDE